MKQNFIGDRPYILTVVLGMALLAIGASAAPANQELNSAADALAKAADALAKAGDDFLRSTGANPARGAIPVASANNTGSDKPAVEASRAEEPIEGVFVGVLGEGAGELRARFGAGKVEWVEPGKRTWNPKVTNAFTFSMAAGQLTVARPGLAPMVYRIGEGRKSLALESGDGSKVPKELKVTQP